LNKLTIALTLVFSLLFAQLPVSSDKAGLSKSRLQRLNKIMHSLVDEGKLAGVQTAIIRNGSIGHYDTYGYADLDSKTPLKDDSIFRIYSMTKPIVSVALMMLYEEGKFLLDDPVHKYIPEFKNIKVYRPLNKNIWPLNKIHFVSKSKRPILIIDLLRHTSGLGYGWGKNTYVDRKYRNNIRGYFDKKFKPQDSKKLIQAISKIPLYHEPGTKWRYGISTDICGILIEVLSGQTLDEFLSERIFKPLDMVDTHFQLPKDKTARFTSNYVNKIPKIFRNIANIMGVNISPEGTLTVVDHVEKSEYLKNITFYSGGAGLVSTTNDYLQFCKMVLNKGELNGIRIIGPKTIQLMTEDHLKFLPHQRGQVALPNNSTSFGLGFSIVKNVAAKEIIGSVGTHGWGGASGTWFGIDPQENMIFILMIQLYDFEKLKLSKRFQVMVYQSIIE